jgi:hypothetical protein
LAVLGVGGRKVTHAVVLDAPCRGRRRRKTQPLLVEIDDEVRLGSCGQGPREEEKDDGPQRASGG